MIWPFLRDQSAATAARGPGLPIALSLFEVFGPKVPAALAAWLDAPGFWLVQLPVDLPAIYFVGMWSLFRPSRPDPFGPDRISPCQRQGYEKSGLERRLFAIIIAAGLLIAWLLQSTIANNDLGWRAVLPAVMGLTIFAAVFLARTGWNRPLVWLALLPLLPGLFGGAIYLDENLYGDSRRADANFAASRAMWQAVRRHSSPTERVLNNPEAYGAITAWPVNLSWSLLANRRSCFASHELALAYVALPRSEIDALGGMVDRIFAGTANPEDVHALASTYDCRVILLTSLDGAWRDDPFAKDSNFDLVEQDPDHWRIYRIDPL